MSGTRAMLAGDGSARHMCLHSYLDGEYQPSFRASPTNWTASPSGKYL
ncbi:hypothetical protein [Ruegeria arenilitoris]|nr:hypothetical protein [Ruegeria arenilitoris]